LFNINTDKPIRKKSQNIHKNELRCVCLKARSTGQKRSDLDIMVVDIEPDITGITKSWSHTDMVNAELYSALRLCNV